MNVKTQTLVRHLVCQCWPRAVVGSLEIFGKRDAQPQALILGLFFIVEVLALRMQRLEGCGGVGLRELWDGGRHGHFAEWVLLGSLFYYEDGIWDKQDTNSS